MVDLNIPLIVAISGCVGGGAGYFVGFVVGKAVGEEKAIDYFEAVRSDMQNRYAQEVAQLVAKNDALEDRITSLQNNHSAEIAAMRDEFREEVRSLQVEIAALEAALERQDDAIPF